MRIATFDVCGSKGGVPALLRILAGCAAVFSAGLAATAAAQTYEALFKTCYATSLPERVIASCSAVITRRLATGQDLATAFKNRGNAYDDKGDYARAIEDYSAALAINPRDADAFNSRGTTHTALGQYDRAILDFDQAMTLNPASPLAFSNRCFARALLGQLEAAGRLQRSPAPEARQSRRPGRARLSST